MIVVCCQVEVSATGQSRVQRSPTECGMCECDRGTSQIRPGPMRKVSLYTSVIFLGLFLMLRNTKIFIPHAYVIASFLLTLSLPANKNKTNKQINK